MFAYTIGDAANYENQTVTVDHFGLNLVTVYDQEFVDPTNELSRNVRELGATTLRFPGGTATEVYFDMTQPDLSVSSRDPDYTLTPMDQFFAQAGEIGLDVTLVIPTQIAFGKSAAEAMLDGTYGSRSTIDAQYLDDVKQYVSTAMAYAESNGVNIRAFEIGNEFWLSGQMTGYEYGLVAGRVATLLDAEIARTSAEEADIIVQSTSAASVLFSPRNDATGYVGVEDGELVALSTRDVADNYGGVVPDGFQPVTVPGQGGARNQVGDIANGINATQGAGHAIDGVVQHYYQTGGFSAVDEGQAFKFEMFGRLDDLLVRSGSDPLSYHITEWNTRSNNAENNSGLQNASMMTEIFFELVTNGIDSAQIWPLSFNAAQGLSLVDLDGDDLSISGKMFSLMSESLVGLAPALDWSISGQIDVHGFTSTDRNVLFVSERSGKRQEGVTLDARAVLQEDAPYFITMTQLWDGGAGGTSAAAEPVLSFTDGKMATGSSLTFDLDSWASNRIEITYVGDGDDVIMGRDGADRIETFDGRDRIHGGAGNDTLDGGAGDDVIEGGAGDDVILNGAGNDIIDGGAGSDTLVFTDGVASQFVLYDADIAQSGAIHLQNASGEVTRASNVEQLQFSDATVSSVELLAYLSSNHATGYGPPQGPAETPLADIVFAPEQGAMMEVNTTSIRQTDGSYWQSVAFSETIEDAVVVMGPASHHGFYPVAVRVRNVTDEGFEFQIDEWEYQDGFHETLNISWMAGTEGAHTLEDGSSIYFASDTTTSVAPSSVAFNSADGTAPWVFGTLAGDSEATALTHRIQSVTSEGFDWRLQVEEGRRGAVSTVEETTFNWVAIDLAPDSFIFDDAEVAVDHKYRDTELDIASGQALFADMQTFNGWDTASLRYRLSEDNSVSLRVQEEQSGDRETGHVEEIVAVVAFDLGVYEFV